jgi:hypothetical protein
VARDLFDMSEYFQIINETSDIVRTAVSAALAGGEPGSPEKAKP